MKLKLDENLNENLRERIASAGHDVSSVRMQGLQGTTDDDLYNVCTSESRILVTLDLDFSNVLRFSPGSSAGIVVLRARNGLMSTLLELVDTMLEALRRDSPEGRLWIVEPGKLRIHLER
jgi:predicted nuclease of predicted toxin-antitoxin system